ncbi:MAG: hypothetical protein JXR68_11675 [Bacteroidales bacterium]|nr:hypothetical protein [Bacteroidales bacterium]
MLGIKYVKFDSMTYVIHYKKGLEVKKGKGLAFYSSKRTSSIVAVPLGSSDIPFIFSETTSDFQSITVQGQISYQIEAPEKLSKLLDFTVDFDGLRKTSDEEKLEQRLVNEAQTATTSFIQSIVLTEAITNAKLIQQKIYEGISNSETTTSLGLKILSVNVIAVKPTPDMAKALETSTREKLQQEADEAIYTRRNFAVEQERKIKETELNTEIAIQEKQKQISQKKMEKEQLEQENQKKIRLMRINADIETEEIRKIFIKSKVENEKLLADSSKYKLEAGLSPYKEIDWKIISALNNNSAKNDIALAFRELAENAQNIQNLNISPELLNSLTQQIQK